MLDQITDQINAQFTKLTDEATAFANKNAAYFTENRPHNIADVTGPLADGYATTSTAVLDAVVETNRRIVELIVAQADKVRETVGERITLDDRVADFLPSPTEAGTRYLEFVEKATGINREFNDRVVEMLRTDVPEAVDAASSAVADVTDTASKAMTDATDAASKAAKDATDAASKAVKEATDAASKAATPAKATTKTAKKATVKKSTTKTSTAKKATAKQNAPK